MAMASSDAPIEFNTPAAAESSLEPVTVATDDGVGEVEPIQPAVVVEPPPAPPAKPPATTGPAPPPPPPKKPFKPSEWRRCANPDSSCPYNPPGGAHVPVDPSVPPPAPGAGAGKCSRCSDAWYCSRACQRAHWPRHKHACKFARAAKQLLNLLANDADMNAMLKGYREEFARVYGQDQVGRRGFIQLDFERLRDVALMGDIGRMRAGATVPVSAKYVPIDEFAAELAAEDAKGGGAPGTRPGGPWSLALAMGRMYDVATQVVVVLTLPQKQGGQGGGGGDGSGGGDGAAAARQQHFSMRVSVVNLM